MAKCLQKEISTSPGPGLLRRLRADIRGQELVEFAFVFPILFALLIGIFWLGRMVSVYEAIERAAREGARAALATTCASCGDANNYGAAATAVNNALTAASLDPTLATVSPPAQAVLNTGDPANYQVNGVTEIVTYPVQLNIPFTSVNGVTINLSSTVTMRQEF
jgi:Flp pilus assembly protein TadG